MSFKFITGDDEGCIYAVTQSGDLLFYKDEARDGTPQWANDGASRKIGSGWGDFLNVFSGGDGIIYAIASSGDLLFYKDEARNGTAQWANDAIGQAIASGWDKFLEVFSGEKGIIYAIAPNGDLLFFRDEARDGTVGWANNAVGQKIHTGWGDFLHVMGGGRGLIYAVTTEGDLLYYRDRARNGSPDWSYDGIGRKISTGWNSVIEVFSGGDGIIYAITPDGFLIYNRDEIRNGKVRWSFDGQGSVIGSGWHLEGGHSRDLEGYCAPLSASPGETIEFKVSARHRYRVTYVRLREHASGSMGIPMAGQIVMNPGLRDMPSQAWRDGCDWQTSFSLEIPQDWPSGIYAAHCANSRDNEFHIVFIVRPRPGETSDFALLANINTWNAYNDWGGRSKYSNPPATRLSFERPNPGTTPIGGLDHVTRAELLILNWLEDAGYKVDVYSDHDFHAGIDNLASYKALILSTHPEYWSLQMRDNLEGYLEAGGRLLYLAANGLFEEVDYDEDARSLILLKGNESRRRALGYFRNLDPPRSEREVLGVAFKFDEPPYMTFAPYRVEDASHRFFAGTDLEDGDLIGQGGIYGVAASGWEVDTSDAGPVPNGEIVEARGADDSSSPPDNLQLLARGQNPGFGADMTYYETEAGGFVFSASSITFGNSLVVDQNLQTIIKNILDECLSQED